MKYDAGECETRERKGEHPLRCAMGVRCRLLPCGQSWPIHRGGRNNCRGCPRVFHGVGDAGAQTQYVLEKIQHAIEEAGGALSDVIRTRIFVTDRDNMMEVAKVHGIFFREIMPVSTGVVIGGLIDDRLLVEIEASAILVFGPLRCMKAGNVPSESRPMGWRHFPLRPLAQEKASSSLAQSCMSPATRTPAKPSIIPNKPKDMIDEARRPGDMCSKRPSSLRTNVG